MCVVSVCVCTWLLSGFSEGLFENLYSSHLEWCVVCVCVRVCVCVCVRVSVSA